MPDNQLSSAEHSLVDRARDLVPLLRARAAEAEQLGRLTDDVATALHGAGFFSLHTAHALGGPQASLSAAVAVHRTLARGDGSAGWVAMLLSGSGLLAGLLGDRARDEIWGTDPGTAVCGNLVPTGTARRRAGGLVVTGRWRPLSGVHHARWAGVTADVLDDAGTPVDRALAFVPLDELTVDRTWAVAGMQATGSETVVADDVVVPAHRVLPLAQVVAGHPRHDRPGEPLQRATWVSFHVLAQAATVVGMTEAALEHTHALLARGTSVGSSVYRDATDSPSVRDAVAQATSLADTARLHLERSVADVERGVVEGRQLDLATRARVRMDSATIAVSARRAVDLLLDVRGASSFALSDPVQRIWRDVTVATRHPMLAPALNREVYGRALLGVQQQVVPLV